MTEHSKTPWKLSPQGYIIPTADSHMAMLKLKSPWIEGAWDDDKEAAANAAFIVKAVNNHDALLEFFRWAMREGPWDGGDLDGASVQDKAESLGLIVKTQYDAEKHGVQCDFEDGDDWFEYKLDLRDPVSGAPKP